MPKDYEEFQLPQTLLALAQYGLAKDQNRNLEKFIENVEEKKIIDKSLQVAFDEEFKTRIHKPRKTKK